MSRLLISIQPHGVSRGFCALKTGANAHRLITQCMKLLRGMLK